MAQWTTEAAGLLDYAGLRGGVLATGRGTTGLRGLLATGRRANGLRGLLATGRRTAGLRGYGATGAAGSRKDWMMRSAASLSAAAERSAEKICVVTLAPSTSIWSM